MTEKASVINNRTPVREIAAAEQQFCDHFVNRTAARQLYTSTKESRGNAMNTRIRN